MTTSAISTGHPVVYQGPCACSRPYPLSSAARDLSQPPEVDGGMRPARPTEEWASVSRAVLRCRGASSGH
jgi:hypothetical protein